jgi:methylase of polypeptide subunit release factors
MGAYLNDIGLADKLYLSDVNIENEECIDRTIKQNGLKNVKFIQSSVFEMIPTELKFDTIISNPPHFATNRVEGYRSNHEKLISLDEDMKIHKCIFEDADKYLNPNGRLILVENATGISEEDIKKLIGNKWGIEYVEYSDYNWKGKSTFYTIILYLL